MCEGGRIRHHLRHNIEDPKSTVIAVGYMAENTLGRRIINPEIKAVKIFDKTYQKKAEVVSINAYSAHAGMSDLDKFIISTEGLKNLFLVHGEEENMQAIATRMGNSNKNLKIIMSEMGIAYDV